MGVGPEMLVGIVGLAVENCELTNQLTLIFKTIVLAIIILNNLELNL